VAEVEAEGVALRDKSGETLPDMLVLRLALRVADWVGLWVALMLPD